MQLICTSTSSRVVMKCGNPAGAVQKLPAGRALADGFGSAGAAGAEAIRVDVAWAGIMAVSFLEMLPLPAVRLRVQAAIGIAWIGIACAQPSSTHWETP